MLGLYPCDINMHEPWDPAAFIVVNLQRIYGHHPCVVCHQVGRKAEDVGAADL